MPRKRSFDYELVAKRYANSDLTYAEVGIEFGITDGMVRRACKITKIRPSVCCRICQVYLGTDKRIRYCGLHRVEVQRANEQKYYIKNLEKCHQRSAQWYKDNLNQFKETNKQWHDANRDRSNEAIKRWKIKHPDKVFTYASKRRMIKKENFIEDVDRNAVYKMHGGICGVCKEFIDLTETGFHVDHIIPLSRGGMHGYINVQPAHPLCNFRKNAKLMEELEVK